MTFITPSWGEPVDPAYLSFVDGLKRLMTGPDSPQRFRWYPGHAKWYSYTERSFILEDVGLPVTTTPISYKFGTSWDRVPTFYEFNLVKTFKAVGAAYAKSKSKYPGAVWSGRTGVWRVVRTRPPSEQTPPPGPTGNTEGLPDIAKRQVAKVREAERLGYITHEQAAKLIYDIVDEYT